MAKRVTRLESQLLTKTKILSAAESEFSSKGFEGAAVDRITLKAGYSRGAFYANFQSKEELFLALVEDRMNSILSELIKLNISNTNHKKEVLLKFYLDRAYDKKLTLLMGEFLMSGIRNSKLRSKIANLNHRYLTEVANAIAKISTDKINANQIAVILLSSGQGMMFYHFCDPENYNESFIKKAMALNFERLIS